MALIFHSHKHTTLNLAIRRIYSVGHSLAQLEATTFKRNIKRQEQYQKARAISEGKSNIRRQEQYQKPRAISEGKSNIRRQEQYQKARAISEGKSNIRRQEQYQKARTISEGKSNIRRQEQYQKDDSRYFYLLLCLSIFIPSQCRILRLPCKMIAEFKIVHRGYWLQGSVIAEFTEAGLQDCYGYCLHNPSCKSFNIEKDDYGTCQLNPMSSHDVLDKKTLTPNGNWNFHSTNFSDRNVSGSKE
eukprot:gene14809-5916_t